MPATSQPHTSRAELNSSTYVDVVQALTVSPQIWTGAVRASRGAVDLSQRSGRRHAQADDQVQLWECCDWPREACVGLTCPRLDDRQHCRSTGCDRSNLMRAAAVCARWQTRFRARNLCASKSKHVTVQAPFAIPWYSVVLRTASPLACRPVRCNPLSFGQLLAFEAHVVVQLFDRGLILKWPRTLATALWTKEQRSKMVDASQQWRHVTV